MSLKWKILHESGLTAEDRSQRAKELVDVLLSLRGINSSVDRDLFLSPAESSISMPPRVLHGNLESILNRIRDAVRNKEKIIIYGDYDVDGITATGILWEGLHSLGADVMPYIPHRVEEGYGVNAQAIRELAANKTSLIITCDTGITAIEETSLAKSLGVDVIITDHHALPNELPSDAFGIVHEDWVVGAGVAWKLIRMLGVEVPFDLVCLGTIADVGKLIGDNRVFVSKGLKDLKETKRNGLLSIYNESGINPFSISTYDVGHVIAPRLNATGRLESAMDSLRILLTKDPYRAGVLAKHLGETNQLRQQITSDLVLQAKELAKQCTGDKILIIGGQDWNHGIIGLVAGRLVDQFYLPSLVMSLGENTVKGSARSVNGFNIIDAIRNCDDILLGAGGHPMAAGFSLKRENVDEFKSRMVQIAKDQLTEEMLKKEINIDTELLKEDINWEIFKALLPLEPFGVGNNTPVFLTRKMSVDDVRLVGNGGKHLKLKLSGVDAIAFGMGEKVQEIENSNFADVVYNLDENEWNGNKSLQLKVKDLKAIS